VKWLASTSLQRKTLISFGFAETLGTLIDIRHGPYGFPEKRLKTLSQYGN
jgi:hypothetical protein